MTEVDSPMKDSGRSTREPEAAGWAVRADMRQEETVDSTCATCGAETGEEVDYAGRECPGSKRECGHHCNCSWIHGACCWCAAWTNDDGVFVKDRHPARGALGVCGNCGAGPTEFHRDGCWATLPDPLDEDRTGA